MQGPLLKTDNFTLETIKLYKHMFRNPHIIVSTWENEDREYLGECNKAGANILLNPQPEPGPRNINMQIVSTQNGIKQAAELGATYVLKTRTDHRMYEKNGLEFLYNLVNYFPAPETTHQKNRIVTIQGQSRYGAYHYTDLFMFGHITDLREYWDAPQLDKAEVSLFFRPEIYLTTQYLRKKGWRLDWSTKQWWDVIRDCIIVIDWSILDLYWPKYERWRERRDILEYRENTVRLDFSRFSEWFSIMSDPDKRPSGDRLRYFFRGKLPLRGDTGEIRDALEKN
jgi:hypothetical protein